MNEIKVFVYGTLKVGGRFDTDYRIAESRTDVKEAFILGSIKEIEEMPFPALKLGINEGHCYGELHVFKNDYVLPVFDRIESEGYLYNRKEVEVFDRNTGLSLGNAWAYEYNWDREGTIVETHEEWRV